MKLWYARALCIAGLVMATAVPGQRALAQSATDVKDLVLPVPSMGRGWATESARNIPMEDLGQGYMVIYDHGDQPDGAFIVLVSMSNPALTEMASSVLRDELTPEGFVAQNWSGLGDGASWRATGGEGVQQGAMYAYRVQNVLALVVGGGLQADSLALHLAQLQQDYLRARLAKPGLPGATGMPFCQPGEAAQMRFGVWDLWLHVGPVMGQPVECEHRDPASGDTLQRTTSGVAIYREATGSTIFTNGSEHWAMTPDGFAFWQGPATDPPAEARSSALWTRALGSWQNGDLDSAARDADRAVALQPDSAQAYNVRALVRATRGDFDLALGDANRAVDLSAGQSASILDTRAYVYLKLGQPEDALADYDALFALRPEGHPANYLGRGLAAEAVGPAGAGQDDIAEGLRRGEDAMPSPQMDDLVAMAQQLTNAG